jgi:hypothetical protein
VIVYVHDGVRMKSPGFIVTRSPSTAVRALAFEHKRSADVATVAVRDLPAG